MSSAAQHDRPIFATPVRWAVRVLSWLAFCVAAYLAWHSINESHVAGCGVGNTNGCDLVLSSKWAKWLGIPVAVLGLNCYSVLAGLSILLGVRDPRVNRWLSIAFVMLAVAAAAASLWFIAIQMFAIGHFCLFCMITDTCGIALGALALWSAVRWMSSAPSSVPVARSASPGVMALRSAIPATRSAAVAVPNSTASVAAPIAATRQSGATLVPRATTPIAGRRYAAPMPATSAIAIALGGAGALIVLLIGGQLLFPTKMFEVEKVAINDTIDLNAKNGDTTGDVAPSVDPDTHVTMRVPTEPLANGEEETTAENPATENGNGPEKPATTTDNGATNSDVASPTGERAVKFLDGKLALDVYKHPLLGSPTAPHVVVELVSYDCPHCRKTHRSVKQALQHYGDQVAVIVIPIPLETGCNRLVTNPAASHPGACTTARMAIGVAKLKPASFYKFHEWMMTDPEKPPALDKIISKAYTLVDRTRLRELSRGEELSKQVQQYVNLYASLQQQNADKKEFGLPIQIIGDHIMTGTVEKADDMYKTWEQNLGVKPL